MSDSTTIEWTDRTWNPVTGCTKVSAGCDHCYAETIAERFRGGPAFPNGFDVQLRGHKLTEPLRWRKPAKVFVNSMSDLFHDSVPDEYIAQVFAVMALAERHTFQVLTKRHARTKSLLNTGAFRETVADYALDYDRDAWRRWIDRGTPRWPLPNVWLGVSVENQKWADIRIPALLDTPAAVRFISAEPLLGPISIYSSSDLDRDDAQLDWVIVGGESGRGARPMHPNWARDLRDECQTSARIDDPIAFLFKQWGEFRPVEPDHPDIRTVNDYLVFPAEGGGSIQIRDVPHAAALVPATFATMRRVGKHRAGRELDGRTWDQYPGGAAS